MGSLHVQLLTPNSARISDAVYERGRRRFRRVYGAVYVRIKHSVHPDRSENRVLVFKTLSVLKEITETSEIAYIPTLP